MLKYEVRPFIVICIETYFFLGDDEGIESDQYDTEIDEPLSLEHNRYLYY